jgi:hypothetical protein
MTDFELMVLSASAASIGLRRSRIDDPLFRDFLLVDRDPEHPGHGKGWNPLTNEGDRYQLLAKLKMCIDFEECTAWKRRATGELVQEFWGGDYGDEAHAILRVAAAFAPTADFHFQEI